MGSGLLYYLLVYIFDEDYVNSRQRGLIDFIVECSDKFFELILGLYTHIYAIFFELLSKLYSVTFGSFTDFILDILDLSKDSFVDNGKIFVDGVFDKLSFTSVEFTDNFILWFIGLLIFAAIAKYVFSFTFGLLKTLIDLLLGV